MKPEHKKKISEALKKGRFVKCFVCKKAFWLVPYKEKRNQKCCSLKCFKQRYKKLFSKKGNKNIFWENGKWGYVKKLALKRDKFTCQKCGFRNIEIMQVDHIKEKISGGKDILENAQTLCPNCHAKKTIRFLKKRRKAVYE